MGKSSEKQRKRLWAAKAWLACEVKKVNALPNSSSEDPALSSAGDKAPIKPAPSGGDNTASLGDKAPIKSTKPKARSKKLRVPSSVTPRQNPPCSQRTSTVLSSVPKNALGTPTIADSTAVTETCPLCKIALATQALFQQVQLGMDDNIEEESTESEDDKSEDPGDDNLVDGSHSDVETSNVIFEQTIHATNSNKKPVWTSTYLLSRKTPKLSPDPHFGNSIDENNNNNDNNNDNNGESPFLSANYLGLPWI